MRGGHVANAQTTKVQEKSGLVDATCFLKKQKGKNFGRSVKTAICQCAKWTKNSLRIKQTMRIVK